MADSRVRLQVEDWVRTEWLRTHFNQHFGRERLVLEAGGVFDFDAVSLDKSIVAVISTSGALTSSGKQASAKLHKIRADMLFLMMLPSCRNRLVVLTEKSMYDRLIREKEIGRVPEAINFLHAEIPSDLRASLDAAHNDSSDEIRVRPSM
ncbi:MAG: hypothetical protein H6815_02655 [Phycisphaeraceae bacterium]|nr:hypothetical protein [Phycisphaerales bacterium]MCB9859327.1 hypothetical protein [Phycisphaeraceae bacterium]